MSFYLVIYHSLSHTVVWTANRNDPISESGQFRLSVTGIGIYDDSGVPVWSTPEFESGVDSLQLLDSGNLVLVNRVGDILWQSFDYPTDTIVSGQRFRVGGSIIGSKSDSDISEGDYSFSVSSSDGIFQWKKLTYFRLLMDLKSVKNSNRPVSYVVVNGSGFDMVSDPGSEVVVQVIMTTDVKSTDFRILKILPDGTIVVNRYTDKNWVTDFATPADSCRDPYRCGKLGLCAAGKCSCPHGFRVDPKTNTGCSFSNNTLSLPESCDKATSPKLNSSGEYVYVELGIGTKYFLPDFTTPVKTGVDISTCEDICSSDCSCLGFFHGRTSGSCYMIENDMGSITSSSETKDDDKLGFIKAIHSSPSHQSPSNSTKSSDIPIAGLILLPTSGMLLILLFVICMCRRILSNKAKASRKKLIIDSSEDLEMFSIAGLPVRFDHDDILIATGNFSVRIGSGGFGTVYKGILPDKTVVAVKKITALGSKGKKEFGTEIEIIGNIHHVNLVKLKGFCAQGRERFLVYEYMSKGSLDRTLFGTGPPLEWQERFDIALGTARGLAYLHNGCEHKIIHCDVKPENILLNDNMQVKISDFGLSKLLSPEQSGLFTTMRGTRGYLAPEWLTNAAISDKTDVYSYGMVLLELIQGQKNCAHVPAGNPTSTGLTETRIYFPLHALEMHEAGRYLDLVEPRLEGRVTIEEAKKLVKVALCCLHEDPSLRPSMANVVAMLEGTLPVWEPQSDLLNFLRFYGRRFTEPSMAGTGADAEVPSGFMIAPIDSSGSSVSPNSFSYMSSQQVSGPR
ncbi:S-locus lectin protein kinase family protein [Artemisia annua]|uniref:Receptor-like serine/threonine-protein kinase n=1 Tax=Artemisia annua TaxID=35608 RepID=A0A2U1LPS2_ARTAN|nr:S-locus lectin protein kinase family protein [Artemisia annua]